MENPDEVVVQGSPGRTPRWLEGPRVPKGVAASGLPKLEAAEVS